MGLGARRAGGPARPREGARAGKVAAGEVKLTPMNEGPMDVPATLDRADIGHRSLAIDGILVDCIKRGLTRPLRA